MYSPPGRSPTGLQDTALAALSPAFQHSAALLGSPASTLRPASHSGTKLRPAQKLGFGDASFFATVSNTVNLLIGLALLAFPFALANSGWVGLVVFGLLAAATRYTAELIAKCIDKCGGPLKCGSYADLGMHAFGVPGAALITACFFFELLGAACAGYVVVLADNLEELDSAHTVSFYCILGVLVVLPTTWLKNLSWLSYLSFIGMLSAAVLTVVVLYTGLTRDQAPGSLAHPAHTVVLRPRSIAYTFGIWMAGFAGHAVVPQIYCSMAKPASFPTMLNVAYAVVVPMYVVVAIAGYLMYGDSVHSEISVNLPGGPLTKLVLWMLVVNCVAKFALTLAPVGDVTEAILDAALACCSPSTAEGPKHDAGDVATPPRGGGIAAFSVESPRSTLATFSPSLYQPLAASPASPQRPPREAASGVCPPWDEVKKWLRMVAVRGVLCGLILFIAVAVPNFDVLLSFCGSLLSFTVSIAFPPLAYAKLHKDSLTPTAWWFNTCLGVLGAVLAVGGTVASVLGVRPSAGRLVGNAFTLVPCGRACVWGPLLSSAAWLPRHQPRGRNGPEGRLG